MKKHSVQIPFCGFYESHASAIIDDAFNDCFTYDDCGEHHVPNEAWYTIDTSEARLALAEEYAVQWCEAFKDATGIDLKASYDRLESPKFYNFETDRLFVYIPRGVVRALWRASVKDKHVTLAERIKANHSSRDGFHSWYSNDVATWLAKDVTEYDHNELATLLEAVLMVVVPDYAVDYYFGDFGAYSLLERWTGNGHPEVWSALSDDMRAYCELQREFGKPMSYELFIATRRAYEDGMTIEEVEALGDSVESKPRCPHTIEMQF